MPRSCCALRTALVPHILPGINLLAVALLVFSASAVSAFEIKMNVRGGVKTLYVCSDSIVIDVFLDAPAPGITFIGLNVQANAGLAYDAAASAVLPIIHSAPPTMYGTTGAQPAYILYSPSVGMTIPSAVMYPQQTPAWRLIPAGSSPPGKTVVNINYTESALRRTFATGNNIWIGSLVYHVLGPGTLSLSLDPSLGGTFSVFDGTSVNEIPGVVLGPDIDIVIPEPTTALLIGLGLLGLLLRAPGSQRSGCRVITPLGGIAAEIPRMPPLGNGDFRMLLLRSSVLAAVVSAVALIGLMAAATPAAATSIGGFSFADDAFADSLISSSGFFTTSGGSLASVLTDIDAGTWAFSNSSGAFVELGFTDNTLVNGPGVDLVLFELGVLDSVSVTVGGTTLSYLTADTGFSEGIFMLNAASIDLDDFGVASGGTLSSIIIGLDIITPGEFDDTVPSISLVGALNSAPVVPEPGTGQLMGLGLVGLAFRRKHG